MVDHGDEFTPLEYRVQRALRSCSYRQVQTVDCQFRDGVLYLRGRLPSFYLKQVAQTVAAQSLRGQAVIENSIDVA